MKILMILQADFPPDIRVEKEVKTLTNAGHKVHLVCKNSKNRIKEENLSNFTIHRLRVPKFIHPRARNIWMVPAPLNPVWKRRIYEVIKSENIQAIHVHDLPLAPLALKIGKNFNLPVVFDMHENYPAALEAWNKKGFEKLLKNPMVAKCVERKVVKAADKIIVVVEEQKRRLLELGVPAEKILIVSNTVDLEKFQATDQYKSLRQSFNADYILTYVGGVDNNRGLETLIEGFEKVRYKIANSKLLIVGDGRLKNRLEQIVKEKQITEQIIFTGWIHFKLVPDYVASSDVCLIPQPANDHANTTIPHKIFQYMALGKPVITSDAKPLARIVNENNCGKTFSSNNAELLADTIYEVYQSKDKFGLNGQQAVNKKYNWTNSSQTLISMYKNIQDYFFNLEN